MFIPGGWKLGIYVNKIYHIKRAKNINKYTPNQYNKVANPELWEGEEKFPANWFKVTGHLMPTIQQEVVTEIWIYIDESAYGHMQATKFKWANSNNI